MERPGLRIVEALKPGEHPGGADLVRDPHVGRTTGEDPRATPHLRPAVAAHVPVEADPWRPEYVRIRELPRRVLNGIAVLVPERKLVGVRVLEPGIAEERHINPEAVSHLDPARRLPLVLGVDARVPDLERLHGFLQAGDVHPPDLEPIE